MALPLDELKYGYWPARQLRGEFPLPIQSPTEYQGSNILNLACTQTGLTSTQQKKLVAEWCNLLPTLSINTLIFSSKISQQLFEAACAIPHLKALNIKWSSITSIESISQLTSLKSFYLGSSPGIISLKPLSKCAKLEHLFIENTHNPVDLSFLRELCQLREFGISAARGQKIKILSLSPINSLKQLEMLWLISPQILEGGLKPIHSLQNLTSLRTTIKTSSAEFIELCAAIPSLKYFQPVG